MVRYATKLGRDPAATYRQIDVVGRTAEADPHQLVELLYDELVHALRTLAWATEHRQYKVKSDKATRATAILFALEAGLDFERGGDVAKTLAQLYTSARRTVIEASIGRDPAPFLQVAANLEEIADAWRTVRGAAISETSGA
ncbi:MAG: flagellar export chaperone FliS [Sphingomonas sp.]